MTPNEINRNICLPGAVEPTRCIFVALVCLSLCIAPASPTIATGLSIRNEIQEPKKDTPPPKASPQNETAFRLISTGDFFDSDGTSLAYHGYRASNGDKVLIYWRTFPSSTALTDYLGRKLKTATNVIDRKPRTNAKGEKIGERIMAALAVEDPELEDLGLDSYTALIWTEGNQYGECSIYESSDPVKTLLAFEKWLEKDRVNGAKR